MKLVIKLLLQFLLLPFSIWIFFYQKIRGRRKLSHISIWISGKLSETPPSSGLLQFVRPPEPKYYDILLGLYSIEKALKKKKIRREIKSVLVHIDSPEIGWARAWELREQLRKIAAQVPETWAYLHSGDRLSYYIATGCAAIAAAPAISVELFGFSSEQIFFKGTFDRIGVRPNFITVGDYKSAAEAYTRKNASPESKKQIKEIISAIHEELRKAIGEKTGAVNLKLLEKRALLTANEAYAEKLLNAVVYEEQLEFALTQNHRKKFVTLETALKVLRWRQARLLNWHKPRRIALFVGEGAIVDSEESVPNAISLFDYKDAIMGLKQAGYEAVLYRWNSPGGSAYVSDILWQCIMSASIDAPYPYLSENDPFICKPQEPVTQTKKSSSKNRHKIIKHPKAARAEESMTIEVGLIPVYVSMSDVAASGGYYLSAVSQRVFASPLTITGSIGVVGGKFNVSGLLKKFGISNEAISVGDNSNLFSALADFSPAQKKIIQNNMEYVYDLFRNRIALGRGLSKEEILAAAGGRVFSGSEALRRRLVDGLLSLTDILDQIHSDLKLKKKEQLSITILPHIKAPLLPKSLASLPLGAQFNTWLMLARERVFTLDLRFL